MPWSQMEVAGQQGPVKHRRGARAKMRYIVVCVVVLSTLDDLTI